MMHACSRHIRQRAEGLLFNFRRLKKRKRLQIFYV
jgi:hypothetical protein